MSNKTLEELKADLEIHKMNLNSDMIKNDDVLRDSLQKKIDELEMHIENYAEPTEPTMEKEPTFTPIVKKEKETKEKESPKKEAPSKPIVATKKEEPKKETPKVKEAPAKPAAKTPAKPVAKAPAKPVAKAPAKPAAKTPAKPVAKAPAKPVAKAPAKPVAKAPAKPVAKAPAKAKQDSGKKKTMVELDKFKIGQKVSFMDRTTGSTKKGIILKFAISKGDNWARIQTKDKEQWVATKKLKLE